MRFETTGRKGKWEKENTEKGEIRKIVSKGFNKGPVSPLQRPNKKGEKTHGVKCMCVD